MSRVKYAIGPLTFYAPASLLAAWFARARAGDTTVYARGPALDPAEAAVTMVRDWHAGGAAVLIKEREAGSGALLHKVRRVRAAPGGPAAAAKGAGDAGDAIDPQSARLLAVLAELAAAGAPCPSYAVLAEMAELPDRQAARYRLRLLRARGLVAIEAVEGVRKLRVRETAA